MRAIDLLLESLLSIIEKVEEPGIWICGTEAIISLEDISQIVNSTHDLKQDAIIFACSSSMEEGIL